MLPSRINKKRRFLTRRRMENPFAKYLKEDGRIEPSFLDQLAFNEKMAELGKLSAGMVHELNTPLSVIVSAAQMILREDDLPESVKEMVERIDVEAQRLSHFTRGLLTFSRREEGPAAEVDVNQVLLEVMGFLKYEAQKRSVAVLEELDYHLPSIVADLNRLKQVFINLIMNALQAMGESGSLVITTCLDDDGMVEVRIADTGCGIRPEALERIFDPFYTTKQQGEGTGLGLFVTKSIVEAFGGKINVTSSVGKGTVFTLLFSAS